MSEKKYWLADAYAYRVRQVTERARKANQSARATFHATERDAVNYLIARGAGVIANLEKQIQNERKALQRFKKKYPGQDKD